MRGGPAPAPPVGAEREASAPATCCRIACTTISRLARSASRSRWKAGWPSARAPARRRDAERRRLREDRAQQRLACHDVLDHALPRRGEIAAGGGRRGGAAGPRRGSAASSAAAARRSPAGAGGASGAGGGAAGRGGAASGRRRRPARGGRGSAPSRLACVDAGRAGTRRCRRRAAAARPRPRASARVELLRHWGGAWRGWRAISSSMRGCGDSRISASASRNARTSRAISSSETGSASARSSSASAGREVGQLRGRRRLEHEQRGAAARSRRGVAPGRHRPRAPRGRSLPARPRCRGPSSAAANARTCAARWRQERAALSLPRACRCRRRSRCRAARARRAASPRPRARRAAARPRRTAPSPRQDSVERRRERLGGIGRKSKRWHAREDGGGISRGSVVARMKTTCGGGSSSVLRSASKAGRELVDLVDDVDLVAAARGAILHVLAQRADVVDAGSRRRRSRSGRRAALGEDEAGGRRTARALARGAEAPGRAAARWSSCRCRAGRRTGRRARCGPDASAFFSVRVMASWPTTASKVCGRHFRART